MDSPARRPRFAVEDDGLASIACDFNRMPFFSSTGRHTAASPVVPCRSTATNAVPRSSSSSPRSVNHPPYFLDACFLCNKPLAFNRDIFMYRGNVAFCSEECRKEEIEADDEKEKSRNLCASMKAMRSSQKVDSTSSPDRSQTPFRAVAAA